MMYIVTNVRYTDSIGKTDKDLLLQKERKKAIIFNIEQQNLSHQDYFVTARDQLSVTVTNF